MIKKELSIEEKAKRYDEALKVLHKYDGAPIMFTQDLKEEMFPELKESEDPELSGIEKEVVEGFINRVDKKRVPITLKGELKAKFRNEFHTMWQTVGSLQFANVAKVIIERLCLHFAAWGMYNLKNVGYMNEEEKAKAYDEAVEKARKIHNEHKAQPFDVMLKVFPELKESEDEGIGKEIVNFINHRKAMGSITPEESKRTGSWIAWLEKQGGHTDFLNKIQIGDKVTRNEDGMLVNLSQLNRIAKPVEKQGEQNPSWSEEDEEMLKGVIKSCEQCGNEYTYYWLKSLKDRVQPKQEWSEQEQVRINRIVSCLENLNVADNDILLKDVEWLKSLRPQKRWKPSDEQMLAINTAINVIGKGTLSGKQLIELYESLKKLKGK